MTPEAAIASLWLRLPNKARRFCGRTIGRLWVGSGWYAYPTASGWHAVNYKNFNGWFSL